MDYYEEFEQPVYVTERIAYAAPRPRPWLEETTDEKARLSCVAPCSNEARELDAACCSARRKGRRPDGRGGVWERTSSSDMMDPDWENSSPLVGRYAAFTRHGLSPPCAVAPRAPAPFFSVPSPGGSGGASGPESRAVSRAGSNSNTYGAARAATGLQGFASQTFSSNASVFGSRPGSDSWVKDVTDFKAILRAGIDVTKRRSPGPAVPPPLPERPSPPSAASSSGKSSTAGASSSSGASSAAAGAASAGSVAAAAAAQTTPTDPRRWTFRGMLGGGGNGPAVGDGYEGLITLFLDHAGTMLCWAAPGSLELHPEPRNCIFLADIVQIELEEGDGGGGGPDGTGSSSGGGGSSGTPGAGVAGRITVMAATPAPRSLVMDVEHDYIYQILARGFASLLNKNQEGSGGESLED